MIDPDAGRNASTKQDILVMFKLIGLFSISIPSGLVHELNKNVFFISLTLIKIKLGIILNTYAFNNRVIKINQQIFIAKGIIFLNTHHF